MWRIQSHFSFKSRVPAWPAIFAMEPCKTSRFWIISNSRSQFIDADSIHLKGHLSFPLVTVAYAVHKLQRRLHLENKAASVSAIVIAGMAALRRTSFDPLLILHQKVWLWRSRHWSTSSLRLGNISHHGDTRSSWDDRHHSADRPIPLAYQP